MNLKTHIQPDLWETIANTYEVGNYNHAILDAIHYLSDCLREKSGVDADGVPLVGQALGGDHPKLRVNKLQTKSERNIQRGLQDVLRGVYRAIRNPRSHEQVEDDKGTADAIIYFIDYLLRILAHSEEPFTVPGFLDRVFDPDFVQSHRYAELLVDEIPNGKRLDVLIEIYRRKREGDGSKLRLVVHSIIDRIDQTQLERFLTVVSDELRTTRTHSDIRLTLQILPSSLWPRVDEVARLRIENKLVDCVKNAGYLDIRADHSDSPEGSLATWASRIAEHFTLEKRFCNTLVEKLNSDRVTGQAYVLKYFLSALPTVCKTSYGRYRCIRQIRHIIRERNEVLMDYLVPLSTSGLSDAWSESVLDGLDDLKESDPDFFSDLEEPEIPF